MRTSSHSSHADTTVIAHACPMTTTPVATRLLALASAVVLATGLAACAAPADTDDVRVAPINLDDRPTTPVADPDAGGAEPVMPPEPATAGQRDDDVTTRRDASRSPSPAPNDDSDLDDDGDDPDVDDDLDDSDDSDDSDD